MSESLAKRAGLVVGEDLAAYAKELATPNTDFTESSGLPYIGFVEPKGSKFEEQIQAGVGLGAGDAFLRIGGKYVKLAPFQFHLLAARQLWVNVDKSYTVLGVVGSDPGAWSSPFKETIETAVLVYTPTGVVPARATFRTTKAKIGRVALTGLREASDPTFASKSKEHAEVAKVSTPFARVYIEASTHKDTAKGTGLPMYLGDGKVVLSTPGKVKQLTEAFQDEKFRASLKQVFDAYKAKVAELEGKIKNG